MIVFCIEAKRFYSFLSSWMCTYNLLSVTSFIDFMRDIEEMRKDLTWSDELVQHAEKVIERI